MALKTSPKKCDSSEPNQEVKLNKNKVAAVKSTSDEIHNRYSKKVDQAEKKNFKNKQNNELKLRRVNPKKCVTHVSSSIEPLPSVYYSQCVPTYPVLEWNVQKSLYNIPTIPVIIDSIPILGTHVLCPYVNSGVVAPIVLPATPVIVQDEVPTSTYVIEEIPTTSNLVYKPAISYVNQADPAVEESSGLMYYDSNIKADFPATQYDICQLENHLESYLSLPKELFPSTKALNLDPNALIDEFCKMKNIKHHTSWILDLEFGIPKLPITRPIPSYNPKFNSIHCKNTPGAIHPGFELCNDDFKRVLLFYYDCIVSRLYRGYIIMNCDRSVENFQSWLLLPMQALGMCWL